MRNLSEIVKAWPVVDGWSVAPEGIDFCEAGTRIKVGSHLTRLQGDQTLNGTGFTHFRRFYRLWQGMWKGKRRTKAKQVVWSSETKPATNVMQGLGS